MKHAMVGCLVGWCGKRRISHFFYYFLRVSVTEALVYAYEKKCLKKNCCKIFLRKVIAHKIRKIEEKKILTFIQI